MKKVLFGGGGHAELPMILEAKKQGWHVITTGTNSDGIGHQHADEYICGDFSDIDFIYKLSKELEVDALVSGCNDFSYISMAYTGEKLGLKGHDTYLNALTIHHKDKFRSLCKKIGVKSPGFVYLYQGDDLIESVSKLQFPVLVKPVDLTGGKGVSVCYNLDEIEKASSLAYQLTRQDYIIVEEYINGSNHGASFLLKDQKVLYSVFDDEQYGINKYLVLGASMPSLYNNEEVKNNLINDVNKIAKELNIVDGLFHVQYIIDESNYPIIIDPCRRAPGDLYVLLSKYASGVDYPREIFNAEIGKKVSDEYHVENNIIARECIMTEKTGIINSIYIDNFIKERIIDQLIWAMPGDRVDDPKKYKAGIILMKFDTTEEMKQTLDNLSELVKIRFQEE